MRIGKQTVLFIFSFFHILVLYPNDSTAHDDNSSLLSLRDFLFFERVTAGLRDVHDWAKKHEQLNSQGYKDFVSKYYNDIARHCAFDEIKEHMFADLTTQLQIPDIRSSPVESQNIVSAKSPSAQITSPPTSQLNDQQYSFGVDTELVLDISDRRHPSEYARMTPYDISIQNKLHQCAAIFNNVCRYSYARVKRLEHENKNIDFSAMQSKLPHGFKQSFEKRGLYERCFGERVGQSEYEKAFYYDLVETYGQDFTHEQSVQHQYAQMHRWKEYHNEEFRKFLQTFALYNDYVIEIDKHFKTCAGRCFKKAHACETKAYHCIAHQAEALHKKYEHAKKQAQKLRAYNAHQRHLCMQEIFTSQIPDLDAVALEWQETHPERAQAYNETIEDPQKLKKQQYALSWHAARCLSLQGFDPADYQELYGNPLQHELFRELLDGVEFLAQLPQVDRAKPFDVMARTATLETFADARQINAMGDCVGASKLIDFGVSLLEYCAAAVGGFGSGVWKGIKKTGTDIAHIAYHPDRVVMALGLVVVHFADLIYNYVPFDDVMSTTFDEQDCERIAKNWAKESNKAVNWWKKTPAHDKMHQVVEVPVGFLTNAILFGCCASFASKLATAACAEALAITRKSNPAITSAGAATSEAVATAVQRTKAEAVKLLEKLSEAEQIAQAPASVLKEEVERIRPVRKTCPTNIQEFWHATTEAIEKAIERIMPKELKNEHIFRKEHKFDDLIKLCGGTKESTVRAMLEAASGHIPADGVFQWIPIKIGNINLYICGRIMDGVPLIGTCFKRMV